jgi:hypothetical protein
MYRRMIIRCNGVQVEEIDGYARLSNMMQHLMTPAKKFNTMSETFAVDSNEYSQYEYKKKCML